MPIFGYSLVLASWVPVAFPPFEKLMTPSAEGASDFCDMSHTLLEVVAISLREALLVYFTFVGNGTVTKLLMMFRSNVTLGWHPFLLSILLPAMFESELEGR